jgi:hypothetical protein
MASPDYEPPRQLGRLIRARSLNFRMIKFQTGRVSRSSAGEPSSVVHVPAADVTDTINQALMKIGGIAI